MKLFHCDNTHCFELIINTIGKVVKTNNHRKEWFENGMREVDRIGKTKYK
jgi:hypothetical protein